jgi:hypothetical protein
MLVYSFLMLFGTAMLVYGFYRLIVSIRQVRGYIKRSKSEKGPPHPL